MRQLSRSLPLLLLGCQPVAAPPERAEPGWMPPDGVGPWAISARTEVIEAPHVGTLTLEIWYPADLPDGSEPEPYPDLPLLPLPGVVRDAPPTGGPHPVVSFSHGYGGTRHQSVFLTERLASHGFVVVGVDHPLNTAFDLDETQTALVALRRPVDLEVAADHVIDVLGDGGWLDGRVRRDEIGVLGHSFGAFTALVSGGGRLDIDAALATCAAEDLAGCAFVDGLEIEAEAVPLPDPRVAATLLLAPGGWYAFGEAGLSDVSPALVIGGVLDADLPYDEEIRPTWDRLGADRSLASLQRAGHWGFTDLCAYVPVVDCAGEADGYTDPLRVQEITRTLVVAFAGLNLAGDDRYAPWLDGSPFADDPDVVWEIGEP